MLKSTLNLLALLLVLTLNSSFAHANNKLEVSLHLPVFSPMSDACAQDHDWEELATSEQDAILKCGVVHSHLDKDKHRHQKRFGYGHGYGKR